MEFVGVKLELRNELFECAVSKISKRAGACIRSICRWLRERFGVRAGDLGCRYGRMVVQLEHNSGKCRRAATQGASAWPDTKRFWRQRKHSGVCVDSLVRSDERGCNVV